MRAIERTEGRKVLLDTESDPCLWNGCMRNNGRNTPNRWVSFYAHETKAGPMFYLEHRTLWQGESDYLELMSVDQAQEFAEEHLEDLEEGIGEDRLKALGLIDLEGVE
jgi:hypothetical protein